MGKLVDISKAMLNVETPQKGIVAVSMPFHLNLESVLL